MSYVSSPTSRDVEREADESRAQLSSTLEQLRDRLSPGQIVDELLQGSGGNASAFMQNLGTSLRDHPVPALLIGAGLTMLLTGAGSGLAGGGRRHNRRSEDPDDLYPDEYGYVRGSPGDGPGRGAMSGVLDSARGAASGVAGAASSVAGAAQSAASTVADAARSAVHGVASAASGIAGAASSAAGSVSHAAGSVGSAASGLGETAGQARLQASHYAHRGVDRMGGAWGAVAEQPLVLGAIGLAIGAAIGAALPSSEIENRLMGEPADRLKDRAMDVAKEEFGHVADAAASTMREVQDAAAEKGLTTDKIAEAAKDLGDSVAAVAERATQSVKGEAHRMADKAADAAKSATGSGQPAKGSAPSGPSAGAAPQTPASTLGRRV
jgi:hypothetical protein